MKSSATAQSGSPVNVSTPDSAVSGKSLGSSSPDSPMSDRSSSFVISEGPFSPSKSLSLPPQAAVQTKLEEKKEKKEEKIEVKEVKHVKKTFKSTPIKDVSYQVEVQANGQIRLSPHVINALKIRIAQSIARVDKEHQKQERTWFREEDSYTEHLDIVLKYKVKLYDDLNEYIKKCSGQFRQKPAFFVTATQAYLINLDTVAKKILDEHRQMIQESLKEEKLSPGTMKQQIIAKLTIVQPTIQRMIDKFRAYSIINYKAATAIRVELDKSEEDLETFKQYSQVDALLKLRNHCKSGYLTQSDLFGTDGDTIDGILHLFQSEIEYSSRTLSRFDDAQLKPLHYACMLGHYELAEYCVATKDASRTAKTKDNYSPIHLIVQNCHPNTEKLLNLLVRDQDELERKDPKGRTPLEIAATSGNLVAVKWLLMTIEAEDKVQKSKTVEDRCKGALHYAVIAGHTAIVDEILKYFRKERENEKNKTKETGNYAALKMSAHLPLYHAFLNGRADMVSLFARNSITLSLEERASLRTILLDKEAAVKDPVKYENVKQCFIAEQAYHAKIQEMFGVAESTPLPSQKLVRSGSASKLSIFNGDRASAIAALRALQPVPSVKESKRSIQALPGKS